VHNIVNSTGRLYHGNISPDEDLDRVIYDHVDFSYKNFPSKILSGFNLTIEKGDIIGIVGSNGIGKTTLIKLLLQLCKPDRGNIFFNGKYCSSDISSDFIHKNIGYMPQNPYILSGTLKEAVNPSGRHISNSDILNVMKKVALDFEIFNNSLEMLIGENASNLSGGERQKIALARLLLENKSWIILDEPTSAMDVHSEQVICEYMREAFKDKTVIIITHRRKILSICNKIIDFEKL
jgi:ABC-type bacteriocin/lantibiotic exporter with double-glycine peptidase domain